MHYFYSSALFAFMTLDLTKTINAKKYQSGIIEHMIDYPLI